MSLRIVSLVSLVAACSDEAISPTSPCDPVKGTVVREIDGDTADLDFEGRTYRLRYLLVDAPELSSNDCFAAEARQLNRLLTVDQEVRLEYNGEDCTDMFDRQLVYVFVAEHMVNRALLERGYGRFYDPPAGRPYVYGEELEAAAASARESRAGLWGVCE